MKGKRKLTSMATEYDSDSDYIESDDNEEEGEGEGDIIDPKSLTQQGLIRPAPKKVTLFLSLFA